MSTLFVFVLVIIGVFTGGLCDNPARPCNEYIKPGDCLPLRQCPAIAQMAMQKKIRLSSALCHDDNSSSVPLVCCPNGKTPKPIPSKGLAQTDVYDTRISVQKCKEYSDFVWIQDSGLGIVNGQQVSYEDKCIRPAKDFVQKSEQAAVGGFPHMALLGYGERKDARSLCAGSLISENYVLTAAHCAVEEEPTYVVLGVHSLRAGSDRSLEQYIPIHSEKGITLHPDYKPKYHYHDISLIRLQVEPTFSAWVRPACLHSGRPYPEGSLIATGWGHTDFGGSPSDDLLRVNLNESTLELCQRAHRATPSRLPDGIRDSQQICAGSTEGGDACQGDSGGPLQVYRSNPYCMYDIVGVVSFGKGCGLRNTPGVYTRVSYYIDWITQIVWPSSERSPSEKNVY